MVNTSKEEDTRRLSGILVHPTSFPSPYGIGDLGKGAYEFIDFLQESSQHLWQVLPLGPTGFWNSPYQSPSAFAGQPLLISIDDLAELELLEKNDLREIPVWKDPRKVDYIEVREYKETLFQKAYAAFKHTPNKMLLEEYDDFCTANVDWLEDYSLFMALKDSREGECWADWEEELIAPVPEVREHLEKTLKDEIRYHKFLQFIFFSQWAKLKAYANEKEVFIIGDIPIFAAYDSADVWADKELFQLDSAGHPTRVSGVPPDYFSATGQRWGNPLYDWDVHKKDGYQWWIRRIAHQLKMVDYLRIDHFRGFEAYWSIPAEEETALNGKWVKGPCEELFLSIQKELGDHLPILAEDLGIITPDVEWLRDMFHFPGMRILQFAFQDMGESTYLPHNFTTTNCICYTGTHDNDTTTGWYQNLPDELKDKIRRYGNTDGGNISLDLIRFCMGTIARFAIFPIQDILQLDSSHRMNTPGVAEGNWEFRYVSQDLDSRRAKWLRETSHLFGRY